ncbi:protein of unknown function DUF1232 [Chlorobaculum parvum NCIB 8327]|uniref:DUF1232 domain-containing protein n=1 Tax=Chlorobaculum parvum (strain DSM 263 / NCIMB 8327) TaxID=517417 RepID=B3QLX9_CHLP8|nr:YkvA family protein [Chlorobaculum parvum]ACF12465.1 protein of unknown function DUF1232 [Chlorobaculum parvum NCIB 8327]
MKQKKENRFFERARQKAEETIRDPEKLRGVIDSAVQMASNPGASSKFSELSDKFQTLIRLVRAYLSREYHIVPWQTLILAVTALIYFVNPFDLITDFIPLVGFIDDAAVLTAVLASINHDLNAFLEWEKGSSTGEDEPMPKVVDADYEEVEEEEPESASETAETISDEAEKA